LGSQILTLIYQFLLFWFFVSFLRGWSRRFLWILLFVARFASRFILSVVLDLLLYVACRNANSSLMEHNRILRVHLYFFSNKSLFWLRELRFMTLWLSRLRFLLLRSRFWPNFFFLRRIVWFFLFMWLFRRICFIRFVCKRISSWLLLSNRWNIWR